MKSRIFLLSLISSLGGIFFSFYVFGNQFLTFLYPWLVAIDYNWGNIEISAASSLLFNLIFLIGAIVYWATDEKELRFLRFIYSVIFLSKILGGIVTVFFVISNLSQFNFNFINMLVACLAWIFVSYKILIYLNAKKALQINKDIYDENITYFVEAPLWKRFFNFLIDTVILLLTFGYFLFLIFNAFSIRAGAGLGFLLFILIVGSRLAYYMLFELFFEASPGKFLTETRVIKTDGTRIDAATSFTKNLARYVPFEPYSFIFAGVGWHDKWTDTTVVKEKRTGKNGAYYLWAIPIILILVSLAPVATFTLAKYKADSEVTYKREEIHNELVDRLENLKLNEFVFINDESDYFNKVYLKPEKIVDGQITFSAFQIKGNPRFDDIDVEEYYKQHKDSVTQIVLTKEALVNAIKPEEGKNEENALSLFGHTKRYTVSKVEAYFEANLKLMNVNLNEYYQGAYNVSISIINKGWPAKISNLEAIDNDEIQWTLDRTNYVEKFDYLMIRGKSKTHVKEFKISIKSTDSLGKVQSYEIEKEGDKNDTIIKKLK